MFRSSFLLENSEYTLFFYKKVVYKESSTRMAKTLRKS